MVSEHRGFGKHLLPIFSKYSIMALERQRDIDGALDIDCIVLAPESPPKQHYMPRHLQLISLEVESICQKLSAETIV